MGDTMNDAAHEGVPASPVYVITVTSSGAAAVDGEEVTAPGLDASAARVAALAEIRIKAAFHGRPVRVLAKDPDGTTWPLTVAADGTVTTLDRPHPTGDGPPTRRPGPVEGPGGAPGDGTAAAGPVGQEAPAHPEAYGPVGTDTAEPVPVPLEPSAPVGVTASFGAAVPVDGSVPSGVVVAAGASAPFEPAVPVDGSASFGAAVPAGVTASFELPVPADAPAAAGAPPGPPERVPVAEAPGPAAWTGPARPDGRLGGVRDVRNGGGAGGGAGGGPAVPLPYPPPAWATPVPRRYAALWSRIVDEERAGRLPAAADAAARLAAQLAVDFGPFTHVTVNVRSVHAWLVLRGAARSGHWAQAAGVLVDVAETRVRSGTAPVEDTVQLLDNAEAACRRLAAQDPVRARRLAGRLEALDPPRFPAPGRARAAVAPVPG